jgi:hypothetical protein
MPINDVNSSAPALLQIGARRNLRALVHQKVPCANSALGRSWSVELAIELLL